MTHTKTRLLIAFLFIICPLESFSQVYTEYQRLIAQSHTRELYESFGSALSIDDTVAVVGASSYLDESKCVRSGGVYIFYQNAGGVDKWGLAKVLVGSDSEQLDRFGYSVCISGNIIAVGARTEDEFGKNAGAVYLFERDRGGKDNWGELKKITASDAESNDYFGESVSVNENLLAVGASSAGSNSGAVYIFEKDHGGANNWGEVKKLTELNSQRLGKSVCLSRDIVVVGSENDDEVAINAGAAYVFQKDHGGINNWGRVKKIIASDAEEIDRFGTAVSLNNNILVIGAPGAGIDGTNSGAAYIFRRDDGGANNWGEVKKITSSVQEAFQSFGIRVSISGDLILVGATQNDELGTNSGSAYIFQEDHGGEGNWGEVQKIRGLDTEALNYFGQSVSIYESKVFVGSSISSGAAYVFERNHGGPNNWGQVAKKSPNDLLINPPFCDVAMDSNFGYSVALSDDLAIVGAPNNNVNFGAAYIYQKNLKLHRWDLVKKILPADPVDGNRFGYTVSISNDLVVVGSYQAKNEDGQRTGAAYIFQRDHGGADNWGQVKKIIGSDTKGLDQFGRYVCVEGDIMTVTAFGSMPRKVYIFQKDVGGSNNWGEVKKITEPSDSYFGFSLAVQGDLILVGAPKDDEGAVWAGAIYVFQKDEGGSNNWGEVKKIIAFDADEKDNFGESISISGDMLLIGASGEFSGGSEPGSAYLYQRDLGGSDNWGVLKKLVGKDVLPSDNFGVSLCINFDAAIIGASRENDGGLRAGAAYIFQKNHGGSNNWGQVKKLKASDPEAYDFFGMSVSLSGDAAIVGAYGGDHVHSEDGLSYIFPSVTDTTAPTLFAGDTMKNQYEVAIEGFQTIEDLLANNGLVSDNIAIDSLSFASIDTFVRQATFEKCPVIDTINIRYKISDISGLSDTCALIILRIDTIPPKIDLGDTLILPRDSFPKVPLSIDELVANGGLVFDNHSLDSASFRIIDTLISHSNICNSSDTIRIRLSINDYCGLSDTCSLFVIRSQMTNPDTIPITACNSFIVPSGDETYYTSGIYADTIQGANGCDSLITVDLTITDDPLVCGISLCQQSISISEEFLASDQHQTIFHAVLDLTATGIITLSESLVFKSGNSIELKPIFEVSEGAELTLYIEECPE